MSDARAEEVVKEWQREDSEASEMMSLYQQIGNHFYPRKNSIMQTSSHGEDKSLPIIDPTGIYDAQDMAAGMSAVVLPAGQYFCRLVASDSRLNSNENVRHYLAYATEVIHEQMFKSNFVEQFNEFLMSLVVFGTGCLYSEFDVNELTLRYQNWSVQNFRFNVDSYGLPNRAIIKWQYTPEQAYELFGENAGRQVLEALRSQNPVSRKFPFLFCVRPRKQKGRGSGNSTYPYEMVAVSLVDKTVVAEGGYEQFPYHIVRWAIGDDGYQWGYGQGAVALSSSKELQIQRRALILCAELANNPPRETLPSFEGTPKVYPGANNRVMEADSIRALDRTLQGNFPITKETIEMTKEDIHRAFFVKVFAPLDNLPGDRRTTVEIIERVKAGYMRLVLPTTRLYNEGLTPVVERSVLQLLKYRILEPPPAELGEFKVEYLGRLALALKEQQSDALQRFGQFAMSMEQVIPNFTVDNINVDRAGRRMAQTFGVAEADLNTDEERTAIREQRNQQQQGQMAMMAAESAGKAYKSASGKAEEGSPAEALMGQMAG